MMDYPFVAFKSLAFLSLSFLCGLKYSSCWHSFMLAFPYCCLLQAYLSVRILAGLVFLSTTLMVVCVLLVIILPTWQLSF
jgi:hypothetical protein